MYRRHATVGNPVKSRFAIMKVKARLLFLPAFLPHKGCEILHCTQQDLRRALWSCFVGYSLDAIRS